LSRPKPTRVAVPIEKEEKKKKNRLSDLNRNLINFEYKLYDQ